MSTGRCDLERAPGSLLPSQIGEVENRPLGLLPIARHPGLRVELAPQVRHGVGEMPHGNRLDPGQCRLRRRTRRTKDPRQTGLERGLCQRQHTADRPQSTVQSQLADGCVLGERALRNLPRRGENRECDRQVERRALLPQRGGREVDRDPPERPLQLGRRDPTPDAMLGFLARPVRETDDREPGHAVLEVRLDLDATGLESDERMRESAREHPLHARHQTLTCLAPSCAEIEYSSVSP